MRSHDISSQKKEKGTVVFKSHAKLSDFCLARKGPIGDGSPRSPPLEVPSSQPPPLEVPDLPPSINQVAAEIDLLTAAAPPSVNTLSAPSLKPSPDTSALLLGIAHFDLLIRFSVSFSRSFANVCSGLANVDDDVFEQQRASTTVMTTEIGLSTGLNGVGFRVFIDSKFTICYKRIIYLLM
ncbi:hypothetical protein CASFOL_037413 [Castilleja foliolosa]|uniref:Uncharacterized protein n=1 Tax=Castilleja foliolosa TaxID=1961234 RepID=A0ABD3BNR8_9LAMI